MKFSVIGVQDTIRVIDGVKRIVATITMIADDGTHLIRHLIDDAEIALHKFGASVEVEIGPVAPPPEVKEAFSGDAEVEARVQAEVEARVQAELAKLK